MKMTHLFIAAIGLLSVDVQAGAITIGVNPSMQTVQPGGAISVQLGIAGLGNGIAPSIGTFDLNLAYDESVLKYNGVTFGDPVLGDQLDLFGFGSLTSADLTASGVLNIYALSLDDALALDELQIDAFTLATVSFAALTLGSSRLELSLNTLGDANANPLDAELRGGAISVVPLPASLILLASGMGLLLGLWRRAKSRGLGGK